MNNISTIFAISSYLLGSISSAILICKFYKLSDPRSYGSKNPGTTNILRQLGIKIAIIVMLFDILKGFIPIWIGSSILHFSSLELEIIAVSVYLGHTYPIFFQFKGGKGVATAFGILTACNINIFEIMISTWTLTTLISGYASLGTIITSIITTFYVWTIHSQFSFLTTILAVLILIHHHKNIIRLYKNKEQKILRTRKNKK